MPRPRAIRTKEEAAKVPKDKPLTVEFDQEGAVNVDEDQNPFEEQPQGRKKAAAEHDGSVLSECDLAMMRG